MFKGEHLCFCDPPPILKKVPHWFFIPLGLCRFAQKRKQLPRPSFPQEAKEEEDSQRAQMAVCFGYFLDDAAKYYGGAAAGTGLFFKVGRPPYPLYPPQ